MRQKYQSFRQISLVLGVILFASQTQAADCTPAPDCDTLGYTQTETDCQGADVVIRCPYNTKQVTCLLSTVISTPLEILYGDGTVANGLIAGKKPIGVVFDVEYRLAVALTDVKQDGSAGSEKMPWSSESCDVPNLLNCSAGTVDTTCGIDGRANTDAILASTCNETTYVANAVNVYQTSNCSANFCQKGKWFLPSLRDLNTIYRFKSEINTSLTLLVSRGASKLTEGVYWSSTEYNSDTAWMRYMSADISSRDLKTFYKYYVRPVIKF